MTDVDVELVVRGLTGIPLFGLGVWLVYYVDKSMKGDLGWRGWFLFLCGCSCGGVAFVLLFFRHRLLP